MTRVERSIEIKVPPEKVWEMLAFDRMPEWNEGFGVENVEYTTEVSTPKDKYRVGATAHATIKGEGEVHFEITESLENTKITIHGKGKTTKDWTLTYTLEPVEVGTKLTQWTDYELPWGIFGKFLDKLVAQRFTEKDMEKQLGQLKSILEK